MSVRNNSLRIFLVAGAALFSFADVCAAQQSDVLSPDAVPAIQDMAAVPSPSQVQASSGPAVSSSSATAIVTYAPKKDRDPMVSVQDLRDAEYEQNKAKIEAERRQREQEEAARKARGVPVDPEEEAKLVEKRLQLQGIIGDQVIVNGKYYSAGQVLPGGTRVLKVFPESVVFKYKKRTFTKRMKGI